MTDREIMFLSTDIDIATGDYIGIVHFTPISTSYLFGNEQELDWKAERDITIFCLSAIGTALLLAILLTKLTAGGS